MTDRDSLTCYRKDDRGILWLWNYVEKIRVKTGYKISTLLHYEQSPFQEISIVETKGFGRMLVLDGTPQVSTKDGFIYNEMISHIPIVTHPDPKKVAMIGGGDCGPAREAMKYAGLEQIDVVEIDQRVTEVCRLWLTPASYYEHDQRVRMVHRDGLEWVQAHKGSYDILIIDRPDPYGPAKKLYKPEFYQHVYDCLTDDGVVVIQSGSPFYNTSTLKGTVNNLRALFPIVRTYLAAIPLFPSGIWSFTLASKKWDPVQADLSRLQHTDTQYLDPEVFRSAFVLPKYVRTIVDEGATEGR
ncbi:polyamine aminopropyltransferase [Brevibacillus sp. SYP-B805]|uniref:polyamine aminopropyltransferase n=1 Tax=Brevibacillus sp. SYP-B805 TaxID=1578199 RepID=UPI0013ED6C69|nr:polyamine aminopropyltransferase [Brevibacillus sp. SYP-B805]NGQ96610.1 polyamine aminopropyltransferase [Brevibacillus sp. SYP-B805]